MVEAGGDEGTRRRLPLWMTQGEQSKPAGGGESSGTVDGGDGLASGNSKPKRESKKAVLTGESKRRKRKIGQQDSPEDVETGSSKQVPASSLRRKRKATSVRLRSGKDSDIPSPDKDDDDELTPEDLLSIAEEYVKADEKNVEMQEGSIREFEFGVSTAASSKTETGSSVIDGNRRLRASETTIDSTESLTGEKHFRSTSETGDPAQDMLDILLGPLLKKSVEEKRSEFIARDRTFVNELGKGSQNDVKEETAPLTKKKSTLRDKVAMLLD